MDIDALIPHRGRWKIVDRLLDIEGDQAVAESDFPVSIAEGHFPGAPVVPGVVLLEGLAQTMLALSTATDGAEGSPYLAGIDKVRFPHPVVPPATVRFEVTITGRHDTLTRAKARAICGEHTVCTATLTGAVVP